MTQRLIPLLFGAALIFAGCSGGGAQAGTKSGGAQATTVQASEFRFDPATVTVRANQPAQVTLRNTGSVQHNWTVQGLDQAAAITAQPGQSATGQFTPTQTGTFRVVCTVPGHEQAGMVGQLVVQ